VLGAADTSRELKLDYSRGTVTAVNYVYFIGLARIYNYTLGNSDVDGFRRHLVGKTLINVFYYDVT